VARVRNEVEILVAERAQPAVAEAPRRVPSVRVVLAGRREDARAIAGFIPDCVVLFTRLLRDERLPRRQKVFVAALLPYLASPIDLIPDFIPIAGQLDDALLVALVLRRIVRSNPRLVHELWPGPPSSLAVIMRVVA
jgi:uncharacterized membrane protein YkvA (DUF1232 family)